MKFRDIKQMSKAKYHVDAPWDFFESHYLNPKDGALKKLDLDPDYQRGYCWTDEQKSRYIEWILKGGTSGKEIYLNHPGWMRDFKGKFEIVDGKQRISAMLDFLHNKIKVFGEYFNEFEDDLPLSNASFSVNIADLKSRKEILQWYLDMNSCGVAHTNDEIEKVKKLIEEEK
jgi:uncharacterized protein with ParB-like and HNH nuclease domain